MSFILDIPVEVRAKASSSYTLADIKKRLKVLKNRKDSERAEIEYLEKLLKRKR